MNKIWRTLGIMICFVSFLLGCSQEKENTYPYTYLYLTTADNDDQAKQLEFIEKKLEEHEAVYESVNFEIVHVGTPFDVIISNTEFNALANYLDIDEVNLTGKDTAIITRYDDTNTNSDYIEKLEILENYQLGDEKVNIVQLIKDKILAPGLFHNQLVVSDELYEELNPNDERRTILVYGYNVSESKDSELLTEELATWEGFQFPKDDFKTFGFIAER